jgi:hypothetical protein
MPSWKKVIVSGSAAHLLNVTASSVLITGSNNTSLLQVSSPSAPSTLFVSGSGNVGIGTTTPKATLDVAGTVVHGQATTATGNYSHAEGVDTLTTGEASHAEGTETVASGNYSHAEGASSISSGATSHAEGSSTLSSGYSSHAEGISTIASGAYSHAEGSGTLALGIASHAEGLGTIAQGDYQLTIGQYNISLPDQSAFIIGNGIDDSNRSNLLFASGSEIQITGSLSVSGSITGSLYGTASWAENAQTATLALTASSFSGQNFATFTQSVASTTWTFNHNLNFRTPVITVYDNSYQVVVPDSIQGTSDNQSVITFSTARAGYASATVGSVLPNNALSLMIAYSIVL